MDVATAAEILWRAKLEIDFEGFVRRGVAAQKAVDEEIAKLKCGRRLKRPFTGVRHCVLPKGHLGYCQDFEGLRYGKIA